MVSQENFEGFDASQILFSLYSAICKSPSMDSRILMMQTLVKFIEPHSSRIQQGWNRAENWSRESSYFHIYANKVGNLAIDLRRIKWAEELKLVRLFCFHGTKPNSKVIINGKTITQNRWVYDKVVDVIPADRLAVINRRSPFPGYGVTHGLPILPHFYWVLETLAKPPYLKNLRASDFHGYDPIEEYSPL